jgi:iron complex outermembrane recepter protein
MLRGQKRMLGQLRGGGRELARILVTFVVVLLAVTWAPVSFAQQQKTEAAADSEVLQEVVVTGSLIKRANAETAVPITILKANALKDQGITSVEQALDQLTSSSSVINVAQSVGTFSGGGTYADLRGLGSSRTLVLLDGQRLAPSSFGGAATGNAAVDLSGIPFSSIDSIEVLRTGASSLYGSDAIAGVINFITKKNFQGLSFEGTYDKPQKEGGSSSQLSGTFGHGDLSSDGYNFLLTVGWSKQNELQASARGFSAEGFNPALGYNATNNPGSWPGSAVDGSGNLWQPGFPACAGNPYLTTALGNCAYRYSAATDLIPNHTEDSALASITKSIGTDNSLQLQYFWTQANVNGWSGPVFYPFGMSATSPYLPGNALGPSLASLTCLSAPCSAPNFSGGAPNVFWSDPNNNRYGGNLNTEQRALLTFAGHNGGWDYAASGNYSQNKNDNRWTGGIPNFAVTAPGGVLSDLINPFGPQSAAGQALINSSYINGTYSNGEDKRWSADGHASHELGDVISKGNPATVALGFMVGGEHYDYATTGYNSLVQASTGLGPSAVEGSRKFQALFMELDLPITSTLDLTLADRQDWYSDFGTTNNPKIQARWQPAPWVTFRGTASTGFRAPSLFSLFNPPSLAASTGGNMGSGNPDCVNAGATPPSAIAPFTPATCNTQGLGLFGGNPNLTPETSENFDFGVVLNPITDMGVTVDYFRILVKNTISAVPATAIYGSPSTFASDYVLDNTGGLTASINSGAVCIPFTAPTCGYIKLDSANTGRLSTDGFDLSIQYLQHTSIGTFHEDLEGTAITQFLDQQYTGGPELNLVGQYNELPPAYRFQTNFRLDWTSPESMWGAGLGHRWWSGYIDQFNTCAQPGSPANCTPAQRNVGSYGVWDGYVSVKPIKQLTVLFGIKNLTDHSPPYTNAFQGNFASGYSAYVVDPTQRSFYLNAKLDIF